MISDDLVKPRARGEEENADGVLTVPGGPNGTTSNVPKPDLVCESSRWLETGATLKICAVRVHCADALSVYVEGGWPDKSTRIGTDERRSFPLKVRAFYRASTDTSATDTFLHLGGSWCDVR